MTAGADVPHKVLSEAVADAVAGRRLVAAAFLTYEFDPGFFEQEILPVLLDLPRGPTRNLKLAMLEDVLARPERHIAVYYDRNGIRESDSGPARLDIRRIPVHVRTGIFHPKNLFALVESARAPGSDEPPQQALIVVAGSANLTRSGWWRNVEVGHIEEILSGARTRLSEGLGQLIEWMLKQGPKDTDHTALKKIQKFLREVVPAEHRSLDGAARPHFFVKGVGAPAKDEGGLSLPPLVAFLDETFGRRLEGMNLEVIAPYVDKAATSTALGSLIDRFAPSAVRVLLPRDDQGEAMLTPEMHAWLGSLAGAGWGKLPKDLLRIGKRENAGNRFVHAKVYRFFQRRPRREVLVVGSINLTWPAHQPGGNVESALIIECVPDHELDFWLLPELSTPARFVDPKPPEDDAATGRGSPLVIRYHWRRGVAEVRWEAADASPKLTLSIQGVRIAQLDPLAARTWTLLSEIVAVELRDRLRATSFVVVEDGSDRATVLVQEEGMAHKPSLVTDLAIEDILRYWAFLTPDQRADYLAEKLPAVPGDDGEDLVTVVNQVTSPDRLFSRFAGIFHAFTRIEAEIVQALDDGRERDADYRLFGAKFDSLGPLLSRVQTETAVDLIERYVITLCATQLRDQVKQRFETYWAEHADDARRLDDGLQKLGGLEHEIVTRNDADMGRFVTWFRRRFLRRQRAAE
jgi:hypothetical protein